MFPSIRRHIPHPSGRFWKKVVPVLAAFFFLLAFSIPAVSAQAQFRVIVHYVEGAYQPDQNAYQVKVHVSVMNDFDGVPIEGLNPGNFVISEDAQKFNVDQIQTSENEPKHVVLLLDTSGSMGKTKMDAAKAAAAQFVDHLGSSGSAAVIGFDEKVRPALDFSPDPKALKNAIAKMNSSSGSGTCLYDAVYESIQLAATLPAGRRAVILLTDGVDELPDGSPCSAHTLDDAIDLASEANTHAPLFTIGMGSRVDKASLDRLAKLTGGVFAYAEKEQDLAALFQRLSAGMDKEYILTYQSTSAPGAHTLVVQANYKGADGIDSRSYVLPEPPVRIVITAPQKGQSLSGETTIQAELAGQGAVDQVIFQLNGKEIGKDEAAPYELRYDFGEKAAGEQKLTASALAKDGSTLASQTLSVQIAPASVPTATAAPAPSAAPTTDAAPKATASGALILIGVAGIVLFGIVIVVILLVVFLRRPALAPGPAPVPVRKPAHTPAPTGGGTPIPVRPFPDDSSSADRTIDGLASLDSAGEIIGSLRVLTSDDPSMIGQVLNITRPLTQIGRSTENDLIFPRDTPVSRRHAVLEQRGPDLYLSEVATTAPDGSRKSPTYGTFINEQPVGPAEWKLKDGDKIRLGARVMLQLKINRPAPPVPTDATLDGTLAEPADRTLEEKVGADKTLEDIVQGVENDHTLGGPEEAPDHTLEDLFPGDHTREDILPADRTIEDTVWPQAGRGDGPNTDRTIEDGF